MPPASPIDLPVPIPEDPLCVEVAFQGGSQNKAALTYNDISCNIIRNLNMVHIIKTHTDHYHHAERI